MELNATVSRSISCRATPDEVYKLLADVPRSVAHFPEIDELIPQNGVWIWKLKKLGAGPLIYQVHYGARYAFDPGSRTVRWDAVPGIGNTQVSGKWTIEAAGSGSRFTMDSTYVVQTPFPRLMKSAAEAIMHRENDRIIGTYLENLVTTLHGGDGRVKK